MPNWQTPYVIVNHAQGSPEGLLQRDASVLAVVAEKKHVEVASGVIIDLEKIQVSFEEPGWGLLSLQVREVGLGRLGRGMWMSAWELEWEY